MWDKDEQKPQREENAPVATLSSRAANTSQTVLGPSVVVEGELRADEDLRLEGTVKGTIVLKAHSVRLGSEGRVDGRIEARHVTVEGTLEGDATAGEKITVSPSGQVRGDLAAPRIVLEEGCSFSGRIDTDGAAAEPARREAVKATA